MERHTCRCWYEQRRAAHAVRLAYLSRSLLLYHSFLSLPRLFLSLSLSLAPPPFTTMHVSHAVHCRLCCAGNVVEGMDVIFKVADTQNQVHCVSTTLLLAMCSA